MDEKRNYEDIFADELLNNTDLFLDLLLPGDVANMTIGQVIERFESLFSGRGESLKELFISLIGMMAELHSIHAKTSEEPEEDKPRPYSYKNYADYKFKDK